MTPKIIKFNKPAVIGGGSWATAIIKMLQNNALRVNWYMRNEESATFIKKHNRNPRYLTSVPINIDVVRLYSDLNEIIKNSDILIFAVPAAFLKEGISSISVSLHNKLIVSAIKGIVPEDNLLVSNFFQKYYYVDEDNIGIITGPCHAEEVALERLSYLTIASKEASKAQTVAELLECRYIKTSISDDIYGTGYSAIIKNIIAIAAGVCHSLGYGDNFQSVLVSNAIQEIKRFLRRVHPIKRDIKSSAYLGDLLVTTYSQFSRNRTFGTMIGKGYSVKSAQLEMNMVAEGFFATKCIHEINKKYKVNMPICDAMYNILYENITPQLEIGLLTENLR